MSDGMQEPGTPSSCRPREFFAPGRVNLIGEHTDYSGGFVMPAAIDFKTSARICPRHDSAIVLRSANLPGEVVFDSNHLPSEPEGNWSDYVMGVARNLRQEGVQFDGFDLMVSGDVPLGAGLSSSASLEVATAYALLGIANASWPLRRVALTCQRAENEFVGARSGIMDQMIACAGLRDHALFLDCRSLEYRLLPIPAEIRLVICNSMVRHSHAGGEYNQRRREVEEGTAILSRRRTDIRMLRDATEADLKSCEGAMPDTVYRRCRHIVTENRRVTQAASALEEGKLPVFGALMFEAHRSMRDDFEASCGELDLLVEIASQLPGCYGARMTGGGFGGCTVNLVDKDAAADFRDDIRKRYYDETGKEAEIYISRVSDGAAALRDG
jgi:galactokinase